MAMNNDCEEGQTREEGQALLYEDVKARGPSRGVRAAVLLGTSMLVVVGGAVWRNGSRISTGEVIGLHAEGRCSVGGHEDCRWSRCCANPAHTCFQKNYLWASCNATCNYHSKWEGDRWVDKGDEHVWDCDVLSERSESVCTRNGQDCRSSKCCSSVGSKCFRKNDQWASCNRTCNHNYRWEGRQWVNKGFEHVWDCDVLSEESEPNEGSNGHYNEGSCVANGEDCRSSKCCSNPGSKCWRKNEHWASCNATCNHNTRWDGVEGGQWVNTVEHVWDCTLMSESSESEESSESACAADGEDCSYSSCCVGEGKTCYRKNEHWAACNETCSHNYMWENNAWVNKGDEHIWDCNVLANIAPESESACAADGQDCSSSRCCAEEGKTCFRKNDHWATCNETCSHNYMWENNAWVSKGEEHIWDCSVLSEQNEGNCAADGQDCSLSMCCASEGKTCFRKNEHWATCNETCSHNYMWENDAWVNKGYEHIWDCDVLSENTESHCAADGQDCSSSKCCASKGKTCFQKNEHWASCNETCSHHNKWENGAWVEKSEEHVWDCTAISDATESACVADGENCFDSKCCSRAGSICFQKNEHYASCNATCNHHSRWENNGWVFSEEPVWQCNVLSENTPSSSCSADGENCFLSKCCSDEGKTCFQKNEHWAACNDTCNSNYKWEDYRWVNKGEEHVWDCNVLSERALTCADDGQNCLSSKCCAREGSQCFRKNEHWAACNATCSHNYHWEYNAWVNKGDEHIWECGVISEGVHHTACSVDGESCVHSRCCSNENSKCFMKDEHWAACHASCHSTSKWENDEWVETGEHVWDCNVIHPEVCDTSACDGCSVDCDACREQKLRDCCLEEACADGQHTCKLMNLDTCCVGKSGDCAKTWKEDHDFRDCDVSSCHGCSDDLCQNCLEERVRDCCLQVACDEQGVHDDNCYENKLAECCEGKSEHCMSSFSMNAIDSDFN